MKDQFWLMIIECKKASFSIEEGLAQILAYMLCSPQPDKISFGMIATGSDFIFLKLLKGNLPQHGLSKGFLMRNPRNDLYELLRIYELPALTSLKGWFLHPAQ